MQHSIPNDATLHRIESFLEFIKERESLLRNHFSMVLGFDHPVNHQNLEEDVIDLKK